MFNKKDAAPKATPTTEERIERLERGTRNTAIATGALFVGLTLLSVLNYKTGKKINGQPSVEQK